MSRSLRASADAPSKPATAPAKVTQRTDPEAWSLARLYANGDVSRLQVIDDHTVLVRNRPA